MNEIDENPASIAVEPRPSEANGPDFTSVVSQPSYARTLFFGPQGLRPGWGFAFYVAMFYPLQYAAAKWMASLNLGSLWAMMLGEAAIFVAAVIPSLILAKVERRNWGVYGLPIRQSFGKLFWMGSIWGFASITLLLASLHGLHVFDFGHLALHGARIAKFALFWAAMFLLVGFLEEFMLRGYAQFTLARGIGFWPAALLLSATFGLIHLNNDG